VWVLAVEYAAFALAGLYALVERARQRAVCRKLVIAVFTQHPIVNTAPPTCTELVTPEWMTKTNADHPHTDPGDGRTECHTCGKWVFRVIHSCKRIPVTKAASERMAEDGRHG
jgi:hypothetical protein